jgi:hypothetical protein
VISDCGLRIANWELQISDCELQIVDWELQISDCELEKREKVE